MGDSWQKNREAAEASERNTLLNGTPDEKIKTWLKLTMNDQGRPRAGEWMSSLLPNIKLVSTDPTGPHPSCTFSFVVHPEHCNRLDNLHGGCAASLFDFLTTLPLALINRPGFWHFMGVSRTLNVTYMRPVPAGEEVLIECEIVQAGKKLATLRGVMRRRSDKALLAVCEHGKVNIDSDVKL
ncbi:HotDog domain-containing protein [Dactylonectria estremocensis]|uniref:HotDog domain-containing protein n=1 Tax=Dactylonectria estremocensis TaxID=1079267 RepID=A0A9P9F2M3_9HYPO|nr:HotDog domain-containing protein [Dactylonectria estremocensis]